MMASNMANQTMADERKRISNELEEYKKREEQYMLHVLDLQAQLTNIQQDIERRP